MYNKESEIILNRIQKWYERLQGLIIHEKKEFIAQYGWSKHPTNFDDRTTLDYKDIVEGDSWGKKWESAWFHLHGDVPDKWEGKTVYGEIDLSGEGLVYDRYGVAIQGITNASIWDPNFARTRVPLIDSATGGERIELWVEAAANSLFGVFTDPDPEKESPKRYGWFDAKVETLRFGVFDEDIWHLYLDARILLGMIKHLENDSVRRSRAILALNESINVLSDRRSNAKDARACLKFELKKNASASDLNVSAIGHAHIDTGWLWPVRETVRKCARTFATQLNIINRYPDYIFGASQPQHYQFIKDQYPEIYGRIKEAVQSGNWELQGGMWVEADCNLISGESMVRQLLHGKNFFKDEFDVVVDNLWLPDVFGYSAALPQILKKAGVNFFLTQKLSWSQFNEFPHQTFKWRGIDGSEVLTHFPPENTYNSELDTEFLLPAVKGFKEKDRIDEFISLFGVGDGGGGPKPENIELGRRMKNLESAPRVRFDKAANFFKRLEKYESDIATWVGELYLELHRGTLTTHALVKRQNRKLEWKLRSVEMLWSCLPIDGYPGKDLDRMWKTLLINQFHDIIPGSSIGLVYKNTHKEYERLHADCNSLIERSSKRLFKKDQNSMVLVNTLSYRWSGSVRIPESFHGYELFDNQNRSIPLQMVGEDVLALVELAPLSFTTLKRGDALLMDNEQGVKLILENNLVRYVFDEKGMLTSAYDKEEEKEFLSGPGNILSLYDDRPNNWDAWDIDFFYREALLETADMVKSNSSSIGKVLQQLDLQFRIGDSTIDQRIRLHSMSRRLDMQTTVNWKENHKMLRVHFSVAIRSDQASFDIQYGYVKRHTHENTSWDRAKFEVVGHKYADLSDHDHGVALLNDCKYGYMVRDNILDLNLLRSPSNPDPDADKGIHEFTYSLLPHSKDLIRSNVQAEANCLNQPPLLFEGRATSNIQIPVSLKGSGLELTVLKKAEKYNGWIIRINETLGRLSSGTLLLNGALQECDLMEWSDLGKKIQVQKKIDIDLHPFEIKTYRFTY